MFVAEMVRDCCDYLSTRLSRRSDFSVPMIQLKGRANYCEQAFLGHTFLSSHLQLASTFQSISKRSRRHASVSRCEFRSEEKLFEISLAKAMANKLA